MISFCRSYYERLLTTIVQYINASNAIAPTTVTGRLPECTTTIAVQNMTISDAERAIAEIVADPNAEIVATMPKKPKKKKKR